MTTSASRTPATSQRSSAWVRLAVFLALGVGAGAIGAVLGLDLGAVALGWAVFVVSMLAWIWLPIAKMSAATTAAVSQREDPSRRLASIITVLVAAVSVAAVLAFLVSSATTTGAMNALAALVTLGTIGLSWLLLQTEFTLRYAHLYYQDAASGGYQRGLDFNQDEDPDYLDFAYYAFTIGMTYQTADVNVTRSPIRRVALRQALLSFAFGTVVLAATINLVAGIGQSLSG